MSSTLAIVAGVVLGVVYTLSPMTVWFAVGSVLLVWGSRYGLPEREARWIATFVGVALAIRAVIVAWVFFYGSNDAVNASFNVIYGDEQYSLLRGLRQRTIWLGWPIRQDYFYDINEQYGRTSYVKIMAFIQLFVGSAPYGLRLVNILVFVGAVLLFHRIVRRCYGRTPAFMTLSLLLFLPTLVIWTTTALKESFNFLIVVTMLGSTILVLSGPWRWRVLGVAGMIVTIASLRTYREGAFAIAVAGLAVGIAGSLIMARAWRVVLAVVLVAAMAGPVLRHPRLRSAVMHGVLSAAMTHRGHVYTRGLSYELADRKFYTTRDATFTWPEAVQYSGRAVVSVFVYPFPWQMRTLAARAFLPEQLLWYIVVAMAAIGAAEAFRRHRAATCVLLGYSAVALVAVGLSSGNVGTLVRHRGFALPYLVAVSAVGMCALVARVTPSRDDDKRETWQS